MCNLFAWSRGPHLGTEVFIENPHKLYFAGSIAICEGIEKMSIYLYIMDEKPKPDDDKTDYGDVSFTTQKMRTHQLT